MSGTIFDQQAARYDAWYDTPRGAAISSAETSALQPLLAGMPRPWLEVGVGGGRFAAALGVEVGIDPAAGAVTLAARRGVEVAVARGEALPFPDATFGAVLLVVTLCFAGDPVAVLREARRVLRPGGGVVLGLVLAEGPWGQHYRALAAGGHPYYRTARFFTRRELSTLLAGAGLSPMRTRSALFQEPEAEPSPEDVREGDHQGAGFTAVVCGLDTLPQRKHARPHEYESTDSEPNAGGTTTGGLFAPGKPRITSWVAGWSPDRSSALPLPALTLSRRGRCMLPGKGGGERGSTAHGRTVGEEGRDDGQGASLL